MLIELYTTIHAFKMLQPHWNNRKGTLFCKNISSPHNFPPLLNSPSLSQSVRGDGEFSRGEIGLPWHKSPPLLPLRVQEVGSRATSLLAPVSLWMPACSLEEIEQIGLAPPQESLTLRPLPSFSPSHPLWAYLMEATIGFCMLEQSREASDGSWGWYAVGLNVTVQCNTTQPLIMKHNAMFSRQVSHCLFCLHRPCKGGIQFLFGQRRMFK